MIETTYNYGYSGKDNEVKKKKTIFNKNGYIIEELQYDKNRKEPYSYKKRYNDKGLLIENHEHTYTYEYDKNGNLVQIKRPKNSAYGGLERTTYNKAGKIIRTQTFTQNQYDKAGVKITDDSNYLKDKNGELYQSLTDYSYTYNKDGKLQEIRDNVFSSGTIKYSYEFEDGLYVKTAELVTQKFVTYYDKDDNEVYYMWATWRTSQEEPRIQLYLVFKDTKRDKYGNLTYQVANRVEVVDITKGKGNDVGIYEKKVIEYEYYE
ncbi:MAG TPA: hypothetical protein DEQ96_02470 [Fusobacterium sp.]|uniref:Type IV secretion protein Rhs n=2 Tax=Fusobacterium TaxID=848 RepID=A0A323TUE2_FUSNU|nr:hypothetical protein CQA79_04980 [Fusobacterium nucleatum]PZA03429.1 hypothetical protein DNF10_11845 [Fusobacterium nucleatum]HCE31974.1 hypothetical protein [Fusobacterium sp.]